MCICAQLRHESLYGFGQGVTVPHCSLCVLYGLVLFATQVASVLNCNMRAYMASRSRIQACVTCPVRPCVVWQSS